MGPRYWGLGVRLGISEGWNPQEVGVAGGLGALGFAV